MGAPRRILHALRLTWAAGRGLTALAVVLTLSFAPDESQAASGPLIIKRIAAVAGKGNPGAGRPGGQGEHLPPGTVLLLGDNPEFSVDSRHYGSVPADRILGRVVRHLNTTR